MVGVGRLIQAGRALGGRGDPASGNRVDCERRETRKAGERIRGRGDEEEEEEEDGEWEYDGGKWKRAREKK